MKVPNTPDAAFDLIDAWAVTSLVGARLEIDGIQHDGLNLSLDLSYTRIEVRVSRYGPNGWTARSTEDVSYLSGAALVSRLRAMIVLHGVDPSAL